MQSDILARKRLIKKHGEFLIDLTSTSIRYNTSGQVIRAFYVKDDLVMRPDLISHAAYGNTDNYDIICKYNGISNPFSIDQGDLILIPDLGFMYDALKDTSNIDVSDDVRSQYIDKEKSSELDPNKLKYDQTIKKLRKTIHGVNFSNYSLPPNFASPGDKEAKITDTGQVILGNDVTKSK